MVMLATPASQDPPASGELDCDDEIEHEMLKIEQEMAKQREAEHQILHPLNTDDNHKDHKDHDHLGDMRDNGDSNDDDGNQANKNVVPTLPIQTQTTSSMSSSSFEDDTHGHNARMRQERRARHLDQHRRLQRAREVQRQNHDTPIQRISKHAPSPAAPAPAAPAPAQEEEFTALEREYYDPPPQQRAQQQPQQQPQQQDDPFDDPLLDDRDLLAAIDHATTRHKLGATTRDIPPLAVDLNLNAEFVLFCGPRCVVCRHRSNAISCRDTHSLTHSLNTGQDHVL